MRALIIEDEAALREGLREELAKAGFTKMYNIIDGFEGDTVDDPESVFHGKRMKLSLIHISEPTRPY